MAERWLNRLNAVDNMIFNNRNRRREYNFNIEQYDDEQFRSRYRLTKDAFQEFLAMIRADIQAHNDRGRPIPADIQLLITLRFYATGTFQLACGDLCEISQPSASRIIKRVSEAIARLKNNYIKFPDENMIHQSKLNFWRICGFPNVVGAIDCSHVKISSPGGQNAELYRNRKGYFSINVQVVCGANLEIVNIVARWPGSVHDARIFDNSRLCAKFERGDIDGVLLGDSGYPCRPYLMTPLLNPRTRPERSYNVSQIRTRNTVERTFGVLKRLFPCLSMCLRTKLETTLTIIVATAILYNFLRKRNDPFDEPDYIPEEGDDMPDVQGNEGRLGVAVRAALIIQHFT